jgi:hypothetical protein
LIVATAGVASMEELGNMAAHVVKKNRPVLAGGSILPVCRVQTRQHEALLENITDKIN